MMPYVNIRSTMLFTAELMIKPEATMRAPRTTVKRGPHLLSIAPENIPATIHTSHLIKHCIAEMMSQKAIVKFADRK